MPKLLINPVNLRRVLLIAILSVMGFSSKAQDFGGFEHILNMPPDSMIATKYTSNIPPYERLYSICANHYGGLVITNQITDGKSSSTAPGYSFYYYSQRNFCFAIKLVYPLDEEGKQIKAMMPDFYMVNDSTLYAKNEDLKMVRHNDLKTGRTVFLYTRKRTRMPIYRNWDYPGLK